MSRMRVPTGAPAVSLPLYNGVHASGFREPVYTNYNPRGPPLVPSRRPSPLPRTLPPVISVRLFISLAPSRLLPFVSRSSPFIRRCYNYVSPPLFAALRYEGTN